MYVTSLLFCFAKTVSFLIHCYSIEPQCYITCTEPSARPVVEIMQVHITEDNCFLIFYVLFDAISMYAYVVLNLSWMIETKWFTRTSATRVNFGALKGLLKSVISDIIHSSCIQGPQMNSQSITMTNISRNYL